MSDYQNLAELVDSQILKYEQYMLTQQDHQSQKIKSEKKFQEIVFWFEQAVQEHAKDGHATEGYVGDVATLKAVIKENQKHNRLVVSKRDLVETMLKDPTCHLTSEQVLETNVMSNIEILLNLFESRESALERSVLQAEDFELSMNQILHFIKNTEAKLENFQLNIDQNNFKNLAEIKSGMLEVESERNNLEEKFLDTMATGEDIKNFTKFESAQNCVNKWLLAATSGWNDLNAWMLTLQNNLEQLENLQENLQQSKQCLQIWLVEKLASLQDELTRALPEKSEELEQKIQEHQVFQENLSHQKLELDRVNNFESDSELNKLWDQVFVAAVDLSRILQEAKDRIADQFNFKTWQTQFVNWSKTKNKGTILDIFNKIDEEASGILSRDQFSTAIKLSGFTTSSSDLKHVINILDKMQKNRIDYYNFIYDLSVSQASNSGNANESQIIEDEVIKRVASCKCKQRYHLEKVAKDQYKFGESQFLRLVRILRSTVMVRVGGGWVSLDEYLAKNDPCRSKLQTETSSIVLELISENSNNNDGCVEALTTFTRKTSIHSASTPSPILIRTESDKSFTSKSSSLRSKEVSSKTFHPLNPVVLEKLKEKSVERVYLHEKDCPLSPLNREE